VYIGTVTPAIARLYVLLAMNAPRALIFRRGPSKRTLLIGWNTDTDTFEVGQWFFGRLHERRCDLSPSGRLLVYFAARYRRATALTSGTAKSSGERSAHQGDIEPFTTWTAVSRPPYLTALTLWPNIGTYGGGGLFESEHALLLNNYIREPLNGPPPPSTLQVRPLGPEVASIHEARLQRAGWLRTQAGRDSKRKPTIHAKAQPRGHGLVLHRTEGGERVTNGPYHVVAYRLADAENKRTLPLSPCDWADWDTNGDLLFAREGILLRLRAPRSDEADFGLDRALTLADFRAATFENRVAPAEFARW
jgi:hypothetical protein